MLIFDNYLPIDLCEKYTKIVRDNYEQKCMLGGDPMDFWETRNIDLSNQPIVEDVKKYLESKIKVKLTNFCAEFQTWPIGSESVLHTHNENGKGKEKTDYNTMIYLNDDFEGGEFYTNTGITIKPVPGRLTFFNGHQILHGVKPVRNNHRFTIIFWWRDTIFY